ncbi:MAG: hypothetical protein L0Y74_03855 [candidate division Zixibacteria bacterium]|nr:hypothetical protein [candidate division Zixibacteria bacterium]
MTLILVIPSQNGTVVASDGQVSLGQTKTTSKKISKFNDSCVWGAAGDLALIQAVENGISQITSKDKPLAEIRNDLCAVFPKCLSKMPSSPQPYSCEFIFAEYRKSSRILAINANGISVMLENVPFAIGSGELFAFALLQKYQNLIPDKIDNNLACVLSYRIIAETIQVVSGGVGPPIDVWEIPSAKNYTNQELQGLEDTYKALQTEELEMFLTKGNK